MNFAPQVEALRVFLSNEEKTKTPISSAIDGPWGSGKSSFMLMLREALQPSDGEVQRLDYSSAPELLGFWRTSWRLLKALLPRPPKFKVETDQRLFETAYINLWRVQSAKNVAAGIVHQLIQDLTIRRGFDFFVRLGLVRLNRLQIITYLAEKAVGNIVTIIALTVIMLWTGEAFIVSGLKLGHFPGAAEATGFTLSAILLVKGIATRLSKAPAKFRLSEFIQKPNYVDLVGPISEVEQDFQRILQVLKAEGKTLVLFVDDLDRCAPDETASIVEALNVFFAREGEENCIFIIGLHRDLVAANLEIAYGKLVEKVETSELLAAQRPYGRRFLEKLTQLVVHVPKGDDTTINRYVSGLSGRAVVDLERAFADRHRRQEAGTADDAAWQKTRQQFVTQGVNEAQLDEVESKVVAQFARLEAADRLGEDDQNLRDIFTLIRPALHNSPRQYKRFFNLFRLNNFVAAATLNHQSVGEETAMLEIAQRTVISLEYPLVDRYINEEDENLQLCKNFADLAWQSKLQYSDKILQFVEEVKMVIDKSPTLQNLLLLTPTIPQDRSKQDDKSSL